MRSQSSIGAGLVAIALLGTLLTTASRAQADAASEYRVKAALMYRIAKFVTWPNHHDNNLGLCVLGADPFGASLDALESLTVRDDDVRVYRKINLRDIDKDCAVVFISESERSRIDIVLSRLAGLPVLTIADFQGFAEQGGIIEFSRAAPRIGFRINVDASERAGLKISSQLLQVASDIVREEAA